MPRANEHYHDQRASAYLQSVGFTLTDELQWRKPYPEYKLSQADLGAMCFLVSEYGYGGLAE